MANILKKLKRLVAVTKDVPKEINGIDILSMPDGHLCCQCQNPYFEVWTEQVSGKITVGCTKCGAEDKLILPFGVNIKPLGNGRMTCLRHKNHGFVLIKNGTYLCVGCQNCSTQLILDLSTTESGLILPN